MPTLESPTVILFDWHATLVDTLDAVYHAIDDMLANIVDLGLIDRLTPPGESKNDDDAKLVAYVREHQRLHPKLEAEKKVSRTDIFEVLFGGMSKPSSAPTRSSIAATAPITVRFTRLMRT